MLKYEILNLRMGLYNSNTEKKIDELIEEYAYTTIDYKLRIELFKMKKLIRPSWRPENEKMDILRELWEQDTNDLWCNVFCGVSWEDWMKYVQGV